MSIVRSKLWIDGQWVKSSTTLVVKSPFTSEPVGEVDQASTSDLECAISASVKAFEIYKKSSRFIRSRLLFAMAKEISARRTEFVDRIVQEAAKPVSLAEIEVGRAVGTFTIAAEEAKRFCGEVVPVDIDAGGRSFPPAISLFKPRGPVLG